MEKILPSDIKQLTLVARHELFRFTRGWRLPAVLGIVLLISGLIIAIPQIMNYRVPDDPKEYFRTFAGFAGILALICATFFGADAIVSEYQNRTGYVIFPAPVRRETLFSGKFIASFIACMIALGMYYLIGSIATLYFTGKGSISILQSFLLASLYMWALLSVAFLISSLMKGTTASNVLVFVLFLMIFPIAESMLSLAGVEPSAIPTYSGNTITDILSDPYPVTSKQVIPIGRNNTTMTVWDFHPTLAQGIGVLLAYGITSTALAVYIFKKREMSG